MRGIVALIICSSLLAACSDDSSDAPAGAAVQLSPTPAATSTAAAPSVPSPAVTVASPCPPQQSTGLDQLQVSSAPQGPQVMLEDVSVSTSLCYDRIVFEFAEANLPGLQIRYVTSWSACGSGDPVTTQGAAQLAVTLDPAVAHDTNGNVTVPNLSLAPAYPALQEARQTCDFEAEVSWVIGTELRFWTATYLTSPTRVVIDIYH